MGISGQKNLFKCHLFGLMLVNHVHNPAIDARQSWTQLTFANTNTRTVDVTQVLAVDFDHPDAGYPRTGVDAEYPQGRHGHAPRHLSGGGLHLLGKTGVGEHVLNIVQFFQCINELGHRLRIIARQRAISGWALHHFGQLRL